MEYIYSAMLLHSAGKKITDENIKKVLTAAGVKADDTRIKALTASLEGVDIDKAIESSAVPVVAAPSGQSPAPAEGKPEEKKEEKKKKEEKEEVSEEEAAAGLGALFG
ncbi:50S ribosomal protein P1 [Thermoplasmatales archaeon SG8-52-2]|nr:MAG: 50S ribosomal protein P1 [Thermoplasmatales archaeon SG8-52-2]